MGASLRSHATTQRHVALHAGRLMCQVYGRLRTQLRLAPRHQIADRQHPRPHKHDIWNWIPITEESTVRIGQNPTTVQLCEPVVGVALMGVREEGSATR